MKKQYIIAVVLILLAMMFVYIAYRIYAQPVVSGPGLGGESLSAYEYLKLVERLQDSPALSGDGVDAVYTLAKAEVDRVIRKSLPYAVASLACLTASFWFLLKGRKTQETPEPSNRKML